MSAVVLAFPERGLVLAYGVVRAPQDHDDVELGLACSVLVKALREGVHVPPGVLTDLTVLCIWGPGPLDLRLRLADALAGIVDPDVQGRAVVQLRDPATPADRREIAARLLRGASR